MFGPPGRGRSIAQLPVVGSPALVTITIGLMAMLGAERAACPARNARSLESGTHTSTDPWAIRPAPRSSSERMTDSRMQEWSATACSTDAMPEAAATRNLPGAPQFGAAVADDVLIRPATGCE